MVQSSSITTSVMVPLVGAGVVTLEQLFPFTIGANLGTTVTALLAALATGNPAAVSVALSHLLFNVFGALIIYPFPPIRAIPLALARGMGNLGSRNRPAAIAYVADRLLRVADPPPLPLGGVPQRPRGGSARGAAGRRGAGAAGGRGTTGAGRGVDRIRYPRGATGGARCLGGSSAAASARP